MGEEEYFTRLILRGTGAITVAINDNVETFYRDFSTLSRLTAHGKYREPRIRAALSGSVRQFRTILIPARRGEARKFPRPRNGFARCVYLREYIYIYIRYFDRSRDRRRDLEDGGTFPSNCANDNIVERG